MQVYTGVSQEIKASPERVFELATAIATLPKVFKGYGPIPAIVDAEIVGGGEIREGAIRRVKNSDGSVIDEEIICLKRPEKQVYRLLRGFKPPFSLLVRSGGGDWTFSTFDGGTSITWKFYFELTSFLAYPLMALIMKRYFRQALQDCLYQIKLLAEDAI